MLILEQLSLVFKNYECSRFLSPLRNAGRISIKSPTLTFFTSEHAEDV